MVVSLGPYLIKSQACVSFETCHCFNDGVKSLGTGVGG